MQLKALPYDFKFPAIIVPIIITEVFISQHSLSLISCGEAVDDSPPMTVAARSAMFTCETETGRCEN